VEKTCIKSRKEKRT